MKRILSLLLAVLMLVSLMPTAFAAEEAEPTTENTTVEEIAAAETPAVEDTAAEEPSSAEEAPADELDAAPVSDGATVTSSGSCGTNVKWTLYDNGELVINGTGAMNGYDSAASKQAPWYSKRASIVKATIGDGVTTIGSYAFYNCTNLESVTISDSVESIKSNAFNNCGSLISVSIPDAVTTIGSKAFYACTGLKEVLIGSSVKYIDGSAFYQCRSLTSVTIPDSVTEIGVSAFSYCDGLTSVTIGSGVTSIGNYVFDGCTALTTVTYTGTAEQWNAITIGSNNTTLTNISITYAGAHTHAYTSEITTAATCIEAGVMTYTCECGDSYTEVIPATGHAWSMGVCEACGAVCKHTGYDTDGTCAICGVKCANKVTFVDANGSTISEYYTTGLVTFLGGGYVYTVDGIAVDESDYIITEDTTITATVPVNCYKVEYTQGEHTVLTVVDGKGDAVASGDSVAEGTVLTVTEKADAGYILTSAGSRVITVDGDISFSSAAMQQTFALTLNHTNGAVPTCSAADTGAIAYGTSVTVTAGEADTGYEFIGWYQTNGKILTADTSYTVTITSKLTLEARYQAKTGVVTFVSNNQIKQTGTYTAGSFTESDFPTENPGAMSGYEFTGWDMTADQINTALNSGNVTVTAQFRPVQNNFTVYIYNGESETAEERTFTESSIVTATATDVTGKNFAYWTVDGEILTYSKRASFRANDTCVLTAVYTVEETEALATCRLKTVSYNVETHKMSVVSAFTVPDGCKIKAAGLYAAKAGGNCTSAAELSSANADYVKSGANASKYLNYQYTWNKGSVSVANVWYVRAYLIYTDAGGNEHTILGDTVTVSAGTDYDYTEHATVKITSASYNGDTKKATFVSYFSVPEDGVITKAGLVASSGVNYDLTTLLTTDNADYVNSGANASKYKNYQYTWNKGNVSSGDTWYARPYLIYTLDGVEHMVYGDLVTLNA